MWAFQPWCCCLKLALCRVLQAMAVALQEQEQHLAPSVHPSEAWSWNDSSSLERASRQQLHRILSQLLADGELSTKQVQTALDRVAAVLPRLELAREASVLDVL